MDSTCCSDFIDKRDGQTYKTVQIGDQVWFANNLRYNSPGSLIYNNDVRFEPILGRLYTWNQLEGIAPAGWRIPTKDDWLALESFVTKDVEGMDVKKRMALSVALRTPDIWDLGGMDVAGTNQFGFLGLPAGFCQDSKFWCFGSKTGFWSSTESESPSSVKYAYQLQMNSMFAGISLESKSSAFSVRCVRDA